MKINGNPDGGGGKSAVIESLSVTSNGTYTAGGGVDGYSPVEVSVPEQKPEETFNVTPSITEQTITPQEGYVFASGVVGAVTSSIDANIQAGNIKSGVSILGVEGNYTAPAPVTESLSVSVNGTYTPGQGVDGFSQVTVDVPQSVTGFTEKEITEGVQIVSLNNNAGYVGPYAFAEKNTQTVDLPEASYIGSYAFYECPSLTTVNLPLCFSVSGSAFAGTTSMTSISLPVCFSFQATALAVCGCSEIELPMLISGVSNLFRGSYLRSLSIPMCNTLNYATFQQCSNLQTLTLGTHQYDIVPYDTPFVNMGVVWSTITIYVNSEHYNSYITANGWSSFASRFVSVSLPDPVLSYSDGRLYGCTYYASDYIYERVGIQKSVVTEINLPECKYIGPSTFSGYNNVESLNISNAVYIGDNGVVFPKITTLNLPNCLYLGNYAVFGCESLTTVSLPECRYIGIQALGYGSHITSINLPKCRYIASNAFRSCGSAPLYIGTNAVCVLGGTDLGWSYTGSIYVPASLVDAYKSATNWSTYSSRIFPIE